MQKSFLAQMLRPQVPPVGSVWVRRGSDGDFRQSKYIVRESNLRGVEYALKHSGPVPQPAHYPIRLREFHLRFKPSV